MRREYVRSPQSVKSSLAAQAVLRRVENERDDALANVRSVTVERDTLHERLKVDCDFFILALVRSRSCRAVFLVFNFSEEQMQQSRLLSVIVDCSSFGSMCITDH